MFHEGSNFVNNVLFCSTELSSFLTEWVVDDDDRLLMWDNSEANKQTLIDIETIFCNVYLLYSLIITATKGMKVGLGTQLKK